MPLEKCEYGQCCAGEHPPCNNCGFFSEITAPPIKVASKTDDRFWLPEETHYTQSAEDVAAMNYVEGRK